MIATYSVENQINRILTELDCAVSNYAAIAGKLSGSRVAAALAGTNDFSTADGEYHLQVARDMQRLVAEVNVPVDWRHVEKIRKILVARKATARSARPVPFAVVFIGPALFKQIVSDKVETTTSYEECAAFKDVLVAHAATRLLDAMGQMGVRHTSITNELRDPETFVNKLSDVGFEQ